MSRSALGSGDVSGKIRIVILQKIYDLLYPHLWCIHHFVINLPSTPVDRTMTVVVDHKKKNVVTASPINDIFLPLVKKKKSRFNEKCYPRNYYCGWSSTDESIYFVCYSIIVIFLFHILKLLNMNLKVQILLRNS